jgi:hypothetical protein
VPVLLMIYAFRASYLYIFQIATTFLGQNFINISVYAGDAQTQKLHLFGPPGAKHDWHTLLLKYNLLESTDDIAMFFIMVSVIIFLIAILAPLFIKD